MKFVLNDTIISTDQAEGMTVLDFVRYKKSLTGTKIGCREGDCGACTILVGDRIKEGVRYRTMTSCLMPLINAKGKHIVTVEGINPPEDCLTPVQAALVDESGTQCGFCTVGFVMSMTGFCVDETEKTTEMGVSSIDGNICRCTGYKSIERAAEKLAGDLAAEGDALSLDSLIEGGYLPEYFAGIPKKLDACREPQSEISTSSAVLVAGGTDLYVQRPEEMADDDPVPVFDLPELQGIEVVNGEVAIGASVTVTDLLESELIDGLFPDLYDHLKLVSSTPIRNMATLGGNFVNASPIGDMTVWFLALDASVEIVSERGDSRRLKLRDLFLDYKVLDLEESETITQIFFDTPPEEGFRFNFEKVCKRKYLDIATVNTALSVVVDSTRQEIVSAHAAAGGVAPIPLYLRETSGFLSGKPLDRETVANAAEVMQSEVSPISDVRGSERYKRALLNQLFQAHFHVLFGLEPSKKGTKFVVNGI